MIMSRQNTILRLLLGTIPFLALGSVQCSSDDAASSDPACMPDPCVDQPGTQCRGGQCVTGETVVNIKSASAVSGSYRSFNSNQSVSFTAEKDGENAATAVFTTPDGELRVEVTSEDTAEMTWQGTTLTGYGVPDYDGEAALAMLAEGVVAEAIAMIPLELGCAATAVANPVAAAVVFPWQMRIKYVDGDRATSVPEAADRASCAYSDEAAWSATAPRSPGNGVLRLSVETPIPNVFGYFAFDESGEAYPSTTTTRDGKLYGACGSRCRGACGPDCTSTNCENRPEWRCMNDGESFTGESMKWDVLRCGVHDGCKWHDDCFDNCLEVYGCGTWRAGVCMHNLLTGCDVQAVASYGASNCLSWANGYGPFSGREDFAYPTGEMKSDYNKCPPGTSDPGAVSLTGTFPGEPFNGMQIDYQVTGVSSGTPTDVEGMTTSRNFEGGLGAGALRVVGAARMGNGFYADLTVTVTVDGAQKDDSARIESGFPDFNEYEFDVSVPIPSDAKSGSFTINMAGNYNAGGRGLVVSGTFQR